MGNTQNELLISIDRKLSVLINIEAYNLISQMTITEGAPILKRLGLESSEIAAIFDTTSASVSVRLSEARKKSSKS